MKRGIGKNSNAFGNRLNAFKGRLNAFAFFRIPHYYHEGHMHCSGTWITNGIYGTVICPQILVLYLRCGRILCVFKRNQFAPKLRRKKSRMSALIRQPTGLGWLTRMHREAPNQEVMGSTHTAGGNGKVVHLERWLQCYFPSKPVYFLLYAPIFPHFHALYKYCQ